MANSHILTSVAALKNHLPELGCLDEVILPKVRYFPRVEDESKALPITIRDETGELEAWVRYDSIMHDRSRTVEAVNELNPGDELTAVAMKYGHLGEKGKPYRVYLFDFIRVTPPSTKPQSSENTFLERIMGVLRRVVPRPVLSPVLTR